MSFDTWEEYFYPPPDEGTLRNVEDIRAWELRTRARFARARVQARGSAGVP